MPAFDYDLVIIGAGPAGLTAGMYAARARMNVLLIEKAAPGGQIIVTDWIENYPGFPEGISGFDLAEKMKVQAEALGLKMETAEVQSLNLTPDVKELVFQDKSIKARSLIIASGASPKNWASVKTGTWARESLFAPPVTPRFSRKKLWWPSAGETRRSRKRFI